MLSITVVLRWSRECGEVPHFDLVVITCTSYPRLVKMDAVDAALMSSECPHTLLSETKSQDICVTTMNALIKIHHLSLAQQNKLLDKNHNRLSSV